ncbi:hypothetical protein GOV05_00075 [Candidatus Woesearchaeota archaeon]|nr:hypothetical protein [Candidatus Woesearchaeota archaeon]
MILALINYYSHVISNLIDQYHYKVLSFSGGTLIATIFLILLPEAMVHISSEISFFLMLLGFILFHLSEKYLYQHVRSRKILKEDLKELHEIGFFIDQFILGFIFVTFVEVGNYVGFLLLIPISLQIASSSVSLEHLFHKVKDKINLVLLAGAPLIGVLVALVVDLNEFSRAFFLSFIIGMLLYTVNKDIIPAGRKGHPKYFVTGVSSVVLIWLLIRIFTII